MCVETSRFEHVLSQIKQYEYFSLLLFVGPGSERQYEMRENIT